MPRMWLNQGAGEELTREGSGGQRGRSLGWGVWGAVPCWGGMGILREKHACDLEGTPSLSTTRACSLSPFF